MRILRRDYGPLEEELLELEELDELELELELELDELELDEPFPSPPVPPHPASAAPATTSAPPESASKNVRRSIPLAG